MSCFHRGSCHFSLTVTPSSESSSSFTSRPSLSQGHHSQPLRHLGGECLLLPSSIQAVESPGDAISKTDPESAPFSPAFATSQPCPGHRCSSSPLLVSLEGPAGVHFPRRRWRPVTPLLQIRSLPEPPHYREENPDVLWPLPNLPVSFSSILTAGHISSPPRASALAVLSARCPSRNAEDRPPSHHPDLSCSATPGEALLLLPSPSSCVFFTSALPGAAEGTPLCLLCVFTAAAAPGGGCCMFAPHLQCQEQGSGHSR